MPQYQLALEKSGYREKLTYVEEKPKKQINLTQPQKNDQETEQKRLFGSISLSMKKSTLTLAKKFLPSSINIFYPATNITKFLTKTT